VNRAASQNLRKVTLRIAAVAIGVVAAVALAEFVLRLVGFEFNLHPTKVQFGYPGPVMIQRRYRPDADLLWVPKGYHELVESSVGTEPSLVLMGCSCTEFGKYGQYLDDMIDARHPGNAFTVLNVAVGGWSSYQGLQQMRRDVVRIEPRVVTIYYGWNDHWCSFGIEDKEMHEFDLRHPLVWTALSSRSRVVQLVNKALFSRGFQGKAERERVSLDDFRGNLREMVRIATENSIVPVLVTAPSAHESGQEPAVLTRRWLNDLSQLIPLHEAYVQAVRDVASGEGVPLLDLYRLFRELPAGERVASFTADGIHLTDAGSRRVAQYVYDYFEEKGLLDRLISRGALESRDAPPGK
jgi:lysophospholipase L1-like esterase